MKFADAARPGFRFLLCVAGMTAMRTSCVARIAAKVGVGVEVGVDGRMVSGGVGGGGGMESV